MYWSIYDTVLLVTGVLTAAIALIPIETIPARTRLTAGLIGGGLIVLSLILGNLPSFTYPSIVMIAPLLPLLAGGVIAKAALDRRRFEADVRRVQDDAPLAHQYGEAGQGREDGQRPATAIAAPAAPDALSGRDAAWAQLHDAATSPARLAQIAAQHPEFATAIAAHPQAYPALREWAQATVQKGTA